MASYPPFDQTPLIKEFLTNQGTGIDGRKKGKVFLIFLTRNQKTGLHDNPNF